MSQLKKSIVLAAGVLASLAAAQATSVKYLFIFGDSYTATGFNANGAKPSAANPIGNPTLPGSTFSGGYSWPGFLVTPAFRPASQTTLLYNYAVGGATVDSAVVAPPGNGIPSFVEQVSQWRSGAGTKPSYALWNSENALAGAFFGINDITQSYWRGGTQDAPVARMVDRYFEQFQILYNGGVRNFFLITVPPLDRVPQIAQQSAAGRAKIMANVNSFNSQLASRLQVFQQNNKNVTAVVVDSAPPFIAAISNPRQYGAPDATCLNRNGKSCLWWDNLHPGEAIHRLLAESVANAFRGTFF
ncbi:GDSL lipase/esterase [Podospora australis]|uniref:GDSL lipase/esterase n=1 Tax=Podospora australis TaxID=1536484 RepID=A0AAN6WNW7_9PEZI|nr:GDSL lipase/esterase [Podospora australis]